MFYALGVSFSISQRISSSANFLKDLSDLSTYLCRCLIDETRMKNNNPPRIIFRNHENKILLLSTFNTRFNHIRFPDSTSSKL